MVQEKYYRYLGRNGTITSPIKLENIDPIPMIQIRSEEGKILTDGYKTTYSILVFEDELDKWQEIPDIGQE